MNRFLLGLLTISLVAVAVSGAQIVRESGKNGLAVRLRSGEYLESVATEELNVSEQLTLAFWVKAEEWGQMSSLVYKTGNYGIMKRGDLGVYFRGHFSQWDGIDLTWVPEKYPLKTGQWYHLAMTYDAKTSQGISYLNGQETGRSLIRETQPQFTDYRLYTTKMPLTVGKGIQPFGGLIDSIYIYDRVLGPEELQKLMREESLPGARLAWLFNENDPDRIVDSSGHGYDGVFVSKRLDPEAEAPSQVPAMILHEEEAFAVWSAPATQKIFRRSVPVKTGGAGAVRPVAELAKNEYESFQLAISAREALTIAGLEFSPLQSAAGATIPAERISLAKVDYVPLDTPSQCGGTGGTEVKGEAAVIFDEITAKPGFYPDPLPPADFPMALRAGNTAAFWVTVHSSSDTPAGLYRGTVTLVLQNGKRLEVPYDVTIWDFALPERFHTANSGYFTRRNPERSDLVNRMFSSHHISPSPVSAHVGVKIQPDGSLLLDTAAYDRVVEALMAHPDINVLYFPGFECYSISKAVPLATAKIQWNGIRMSETPGTLTPEFKAVFRRYIKQMSDHLRQKGWFDKARFMVVDEPGLPVDFALCREFFAILQELEPELPVMITKWPSSASAGCGNLWCLGFFQHQSMKEALRRGERLEFYPNWHVFIDRSVMDSRVLGFIMWKYGLTGLLIWRVDHGWDVSNRNVWNNPSYVYPDGRKLWGNGMLIYPDEQYNPISSIRWESLRDTLEEYEYLFLLNELIGSASAAAPEAAETAGKLLRSSVDRLVMNYEAYEDRNAWREIRWSTDDQVLFEVRRQLADAIVNLQKILGENQ